MTPTPKAQVGEEHRKLGAEIRALVFRYINFVQQDQPWPVLDSNIAQAVADTLAEREERVRRDEAQWWYDYFLGKPQSGKLGIERLNEAHDRIHAAGGVCCEKGCMLAAAQRKSVTP